MLDNLKNKLIKIANVKENEYKNWSLKLLRINDPSEVTPYTACAVKLDPPGTLQELTISTIQKYSESFEKMYSGCKEYDGSCDQNTIYIPPIESPKENPHCLENLINSLSHAIREEKPLKLKANAYVISFNVQSTDEAISVKLVSIQAPLTTLKHKFLYDNQTFKKYEEKVLTLRETIDVLIYNDTEVYFFDLKGEKLFAMERAHQTNCVNMLQEINKHNIVSDYNQFVTFARSGINPRRFMSFNDNRLSVLANPGDERNTIVQLFDLKMTPEGKFDTSDKEKAEKLIKVLCKKGMSDPFNNEPVEVSSSKNW